MDFEFKRASKQVRHAMRYAAYLELGGIRQGTGSFERIPLDIEVSLGEQSYVDHHDGFGFSIRFRRVVVEVIPVRSMIQLGDRYRRTLDEEEFSQFLKRVVETSKSGNAGGKVGVSTRLSNILSAVGISGEAQAEVAAAVAKGDTNTVQGKIRFKIVRDVAGGRWEIGHETLGDPSEIDGLLKGAYFSQPADGKGEDDHSPLCWLEPEHGQDRYWAIVELRAKKSDCVYTPIGPKATGRRWEVKNKNLIEKALALKTLEEANREAGLEPPDGEIVLARGEVVVQRNVAKK